MIKFHSAYKLNDRVHYSNEVGMVVIITISCVVTGVPNERLYSHCQWWGMEGGTMVTGGGGGLIKSVVRRRVQLQASQKCFYNCISLHSGGERSLYLDVVLNELITMCSSTNSFYQL